MMRHSMISRLTCATALGAAVTTAVLLLMQSLIENHDSAFDEHPPGATLAFLPVIEPTPPERANRRVEPPPDPVSPPPPPPRVADPGPEVTAGFRLTPPPTEDPRGPVQGAFMDGEALPVVKVRPAYPSRAQQQGIEGYVLVQFTIDELGRVVDVSVVEAQPPGVFERAALRAVERFRYKPRVVNGQPTAVSGVQHLISFALDS